MPKYLISFEKGAMDHLAEEDWPEVGKASHAVEQEAKDAGVFVFAGGLDYEDDDVEAAVVATDGMVTDGPYPETKELIGGLMIVDVPTREARPGVGRQERGRLPLCARRPQVHVRPGDRMRSRRGSICCPSTAPPRTARP